MKQNFRLNKERLIVMIIGFFVGRAVCFSMNPLAAAFWLAAQAEAVAGMWLYLAMVIGMVSRKGLVFGLSFTIYSFLVMITVRAYTERIKNREKTQRDTICLCIIGGMCLIASQLFVWTIGLDKMDIVSVVNGENIRYIWKNNKYTLLALVQVLLEGVLSTSVSFLLLTGLSKEERQLMKTGGADRKGFLAGCLLLAILLYGLPAGLYSTFAIAESVCYLVILVVAYVFGVLESTTAAALCGAVLAYRLNDFSVLGLVTLFGLSAGFLRTMGRIGIFTGMALAAVAVYLGVPDTSLATNSLKGLVTSGVIFLFMPRSLLMKKTKEEESTYNLVQEQLGKTVRERIRDFSGGFFQLQNSLLRLPKPAEGFTDKEISMMYLQMKESVCDRCESRYRCFHVNAQETFLAAKSIFQALDKRGRITKEDVPLEFAQTCDNQESFMVGANVSFERARSNRIIQRKLVESREILATQIGDVARLMNEFSGEIMDACGRDEEHEVLLRFKLYSYGVEVRQVFWWKREEQPDMLYVVARCRQGEMMTAREMAQHISGVYERNYIPCEHCRAMVTRHYEVYSFAEDARYRVSKGVRRIAYEGVVSGDNFSYLELESGMFAAMLSDGMGTGESAYEQSALLIDLLEDFLQAGFPEKTALSLANSVLTLKDTVASFSTLDMVLMDSYTGKTKMIKIGAAASFIKRGEEVITVVSSSLPAGVFSVMDYEVSEYMLSEGDMVFLVSDGVMDAILVEEKETYMSEEIRKLSTKNPQKAVDTLLEGIREKAPGRIKDDMTIMAFSIWKK